MHGASTAVEGVHGFLLRVGQVLLREGITCICAGGGGIPVAQERSSESSSGWRRHGVEAVIDKARLLSCPPALSHTAALLLLEMPCPCLRTCL
jgi:carbamate kinase